jgi:plastocyanin domain-containing protein
MSRTAVATIAGAFLLIGTASGQALDFREAWWAAVGPDGTQRINIRCGTNFLDPENIVVKANVPVVLTVSTERNLVAHNFTFQVPGAGASNADAPVSPSQREFRFAPGLPGRYVLACRDTTRSVGAPSDRRKQGTLSVVP